MHSYALAELCVYKNNLPCANGINVTQNWLIYYSSGCSGCYQHCSRVSETSWLYPLRILTQNQVFFNFHCLSPKKSSGIQLQKLHHCYSFSCCKREKRTIQKDEKHIISGTWQSPLAKVVNIPFSGTWSY